MYCAGFSSSTGEAACFGPPIVSGGPCTNLDKTTKEDGETYKLNATYKLADDKMVYATYSTGYRPGGINRRGTLPPYKSDFLTNYELGWKTTWLDNSFRWNGAVYFDTWKDFQFSFLGANGLTEIRNAAQAEMKGVETDINWRVSEALTIFGSAAYTDAELTKPYCPDLSTNPTCAGTVQAASGTRLPITPEFKANLTGRYEWDAGDNRAHLQGTIVYQGESTADLRNTESALLGKLPAFTAVDFTAGLKNPRWSVEMFLKNAFDERGQVSRYAECAILTCGPQTYIVPIRPRQFGIRVGQTF
jgi:outer membrane receptor protein involved in Fe transport